MKRYLIEILIIVIISASYGFVAYQRNFVWEDDFSLKKAGKLDQAWRPAER